MQVRTVMIRRHGTRPDGSAVGMTRMPSGQHISGEEAGGELALVAAAEGLGAATVAGWSDAERQLVAQARLAERGRLAEGGRSAG